MPQASPVHTLNGPPAYLMGAAQSLVLAPGLAHWRRADQGPKSRLDSLTAGPKIPAQFPPCQSGKTTAEHRSALGLPLVIAHSVRQNGLPVWIVAEQGVR